MDLYPTLVDLAGLTDGLQKGLEGVSLAPVLADPKASVKEAAITQHQHPFYGSSENWKAQGYSIRTERWRYTEWRNIRTGALEARELYDHANDPRETANVVDKIRFADTAAKLATLLQPYARPKKPGP